MLLLACWRLSIYAVAAARRYSRDFIINMAICAICSSHNQEQIVPELIDLGEHSPGVNQHTRSSRQIPIDCSTISFLSLNLKQSSSHCPHEIGLGGGVGHTRRGYIQPFVEYHFSHIRIVGYLSYKGELLGRGKMHCSRSSQHGLSCPVIQASLPAPVQVGSVADGAGAGAGEQYP